MVAPRIALIVAVFVSLVLPVANTVAQVKLPRIGVLVFGALELFQAPFREGLRDLGHIEGQTVLIEWRSAGGKDDRLAAHAAELARLNVDVIVAWPTPSVHAAKRATTRIPIVMLAGDPIATGLIASLGRPGGNVTGVATFSAALNGKRLELLREILPRTTRVAAITHATDPFARPFLDELLVAGRQAGVHVQPFVVRSAEDCDEAFAAVARDQIGVIFVQPILVQASASGRRVADLAIKHRLAATSERYFTEQGGLLSYGVDPVQSRRQTAAFVDKILKGAKPEDLPVEQPTKVEFVLNLKSAKALGITIPQTVLIRADHVIPP